MEVIIQSLGFKGSETLDSFIREKVNSIKDDHVIRANVVLYKGPASNPENDYCEIRLEVPGNDHFVKKHSQYFETSVSECVDILQQMLTKAKDKKSVYQPTKEMIADELVASEDEDIQGI